LDSFFQNSVCAPEFGSFRRELKLETGNWKLETNSRVAAQFFVAFVVPW